MRNLLFFSPWINSAPGCLGLEYPDNRNGLVRVTAFFLFCVDSR